ncbi:MAG: hypothetical protein ACPG31_11090 [Planctomycetota bacterium]
MASIWTPQSDIKPAGFPRDTTPGVDTVDEIVARESEAIRQAVQVFADDAKNGLTPYLSEDGRIRIYTDFRSKDAKSAFKRVGLMFESVDTALGYAGEEPEPLFAFLIARSTTYHGLCDAIAEAGPMQANFMQQSKETTGFTIFAPELTVYFHDLSVQEEARPDHSIGHNLIHLEMHRRYGVLPLWIRESIATAAEDMATGEVYAPWHLNGFVFTASHTEWRGKQTRKQMAALQNFDALFSYSAKPYRDDLAHLGFGFAVYTMLEEPEELRRFLTAMQDKYAEVNLKGGRPAFTLEMTRTMFEDAFENPDDEKPFLERFQKWWKKPTKWNKKPKKRKR